MGGSGSELCLRRSVCSILWSTALQILFLGAFVFFVNIDLLDPLSWLPTWYNAFTSPATWIRSLPLLLITIIEGIVTAKLYITAPKLRRTRFAILSYFFSFHNQTTAALYVFISFTVSWIYSSLAGDSYNSLTVDCKYPNGCLNEDRFFLTLGGLFMGLYYFLHGHLMRKRSLEFPFIQQRKLAQVKCKLFPTVKSAMNYVFKPVLIYMTLYYLKGGALRNSFCYIFTIPPSKELMDTFVGLFKIRTLFYFWLFSTVFVVSIRLMELMFCIYMTERQVFPLHPNRTSDEPLLKDALTNNVYPIINHLGFFDLYLLSLKDPKRREALFTLSQPGGHPHTWNEIKVACFSLLDKFSESLENSLRVPYKQPIFIPQPKPVRILHSPTLNVSSNLPLKVSSRTSPHRSSNIHVSSRTSPHRSSDIQHSFLNHSPPNKERSPLNKDKKLKKENQLNNAKLYQEDQLLNYFIQWYTSTVEHVKKLPFVAYFIDELPEAMTDHLLLDGLPVMWAAHSLSLLACCSLQEDSYGILQNDLVKIITCLLDLKRALDNLVKHGGSMKKSPKQDIMSARMRNALRASIKRCLYRIAIHFKLYLTDIHLPKEAELQMLLYATFREY